MNLVVALSQRLNLSERSVEAVLKLLDQDNTIPFIARYRKEATGNLDEVALLAIRDTRERLVELDKRKAVVLASLKETGHWTPELGSKIEGAESLSDVEDLYLPYRPKRKTRASVARDRGLSPLADVLWAHREPNPQELAAYLGPEVPTAEEALAGARDIVAERIAEVPEVRRRLRERFAREGRLAIEQARGAPTDHAYSQAVGKGEVLSVMPGHRLLAAFRGESEGFLRLAVTVDLGLARDDVARAAWGGRVGVGQSLGMALDDSLKRLLVPSLENEVLQAARQRAEEGAIRIFGENLRQVLLAAPLGQKALLAVDPGFRTGCKVVVLSAQGSLLEHSVIAPLEPHKRTAEAEAFVRGALSRHRLQGVAVGNGTGGREAEAWLRSLNLGVPVISVNESGASVYSASEIAREEFPDQDLTVRGAVSIGRRLMDPLAELIKVDPRSIGVGQYQHDVDPKALKKHLDDVVVSCVNTVGVDLNLATKPILTYVAGLNPRLAQAVVDHRERHGPYRSRQELLAVKGLGPKAFEQAAGFLRIPGAENPLDASAVHPERYAVVETIAQTAHCSVQDLVGRSDLRRLVAGYAGSWNVGPETLADIVAELEKPGRDPRPEFDVPIFDDAIRSIDDLREGLVLEGFVTNVTDFGAFVDIGVHQDGLVHVSELSNEFVRRALDVVTPGQRVRVMVLGVDLAKKRIRLSRKAVWSDEARRDPALGPGLG